MSKTPYEIDIERVQEFSRQTLEQLYVLPDRLVIGGAGALIGVGVGTLLRNGHTLQQVHEIVDALAALHAQGVGADAAPEEPN